MIKFEQVKKRYPDGFEALQDVTFSLNRGEMAFLTGHSGAGKSTLLKLMMLMERASEGTVSVGGQNLSNIPKRQIPYFRRHVGVVFQNHRLLFDRTVFDNVALPLEISGMSQRDIGKRVRAALDKVGLLSKEKLSPIQLSGGEQQRVGIARALIHQPSLIFADEPTASLDPNNSIEIVDLLLGLQEEYDSTILMVTHTPKLVDGLDGVLKFEKAEQSEKYRLVTD